MLRYSLIVPQYRSKEWEKQLDLLQPDHGARDFHFPIAAGAVHGCVCQQTFDRILWLKFCIGRGSCRLIRPSVQGVGGSPYEMVKGATNFFTGLLFCLAGGKKTLQSGAAFPAAPDGEYFLTGKENAQSSSFSVFTLVSTSTSPSASTSRSTLTLRSTS